MTNQYRFLGRLCLLLLGGAVVACQSLVELDEPAKPEGVAVRKGATLLTELDESVWQLKQDPERVYWLGVRGAGTLRKNGTSENAAGNGELDANLTYGLRSCEKSRCTTTLVTYAETSGTRPIPFTIHGNAIYWLDRSNDENEFGYGFVYTCPLTGCNGNPKKLLERLVSMDWSPSEGFFISEGNDELYILTDENELLHCDPEQCEATLQSINLHDSLGDKSLRLVTNAGNYAYGLVDHTLARLSLSDPGTIEELVDKQHLVVNLALSGNELTWINGGYPGQLVRCTLPECHSPRTVASDQSFPIDLAFATSALFWVTEPLDETSTLWYCPKTNDKSGMIVWAKDATAVVTEDQTVCWGTGVFADGAHHGSLSCEAF